MTLATAVALCVAPRPAVDNTVNGLLQVGDEGAAHYREFEAQFGTDEVLVARIEHTDLSVLLRQATALSTLIEDDPTIERVISPSTLYRAELEVLTDPEMGGLAELDRLKPRFAGPLGKALRVLDLEGGSATVYGLSRLRPAREREPLANALAHRAKAITAAGGRLRLAGPPMLNLQLDRESRNVEQTALPLLVGVCVLFLLLLTRSPVLTGAVLLPVGLGVFAAEGAYGAFGAPTNMIVNIAKPLLLVLILASGLHVLVGFADARASGEDAPTASGTAVRKKGRAVALALFTTAAGFASLMISPVLAIRRFGAITAGGLLFAIALVLLVLPALLARVGHRTPPRRSDRLAELSWRTVQLGLSSPMVLVLLALAATAAGFWSLTRVQTDPHAIRYFSESHPLRTDHEALERAGYGLSTLEVVVTATHTFDQADALERLDRITRKLEREDGVRAAIALPVFLREGQFRSTQNDLVPNQLAVDAVFEQRADQLRDFITPDRRTARIALMIDTIDSAALDVLSRRSERIVQTGLPKAQMRATGSYRLLLDAQRSLIKTLLGSLLATALLMELILLLLIRSFRLALAALLPNLLPVALNFGLMAAAGISLDIGTAMTGAIALGIAVDDTLHFVVAWQDGNLESAARSTGRAMIMTSIVVGAGFLALTTSGFGPTRNFGLLTSAAVLTALASDLVLLPALLTLTGANRNQPGPQH